MVTVKIWLSENERIRGLSSLLIVVRGGRRDACQDPEEALNLVIMNGLNIDPDAQSWLVLSVVR